MRFAIDTGGTFTDLAIEDDSGRLHQFKASTTPDDPVVGLLDVLEVGADALGLTRRDLLQRGDMLLHGTTRAINAVVTETTARTAFLTTAGHPDILLFREGGRTRPFDRRREFPDPYVPRSLTFEVPERIGSQGEIVLPLDEGAVRLIADRLIAVGVEAVGVCLLWSIMNPAHELRVGRILAESLPGVPYTLSHRLNPILREYRRASSTVIDASLKPVMTEYLRGLERRLREAGFAGRVLVSTSTGGVMDAIEVADAPIHALNSGPAMAPIAGRRYADADASMSTAIVADTGGTTYDLSLVQRGRIPSSAETWIGEPYLGHMTGFPSVAVRSIGAGGGSIAWVDEYGLLHVGPQSAGALPGPACYGRGGDRPTVTDACLVLGYLDAEYFLGGSMKLDTGAAQCVLGALALTLDLGVEEAAQAVLDLATENMVQAIEAITIDQGIDPTQAVLIGGGGAAGLNASAIASRLGCPRVVIPQTASVMSAVGMLLSNLVGEFRATFVVSSREFDFVGVNRVLSDLESRAAAFIRSAGAADADSSTTFVAEARYPNQIWELPVELRSVRLISAEDVDTLSTDFHRIHEEVFAISDPESPIEVVSWRVRVDCRLSEMDLARVADPNHEKGSRSRPVWFPPVGPRNAGVFEVSEMTPGRAVDGPAIIESPLMTVVVGPGDVVFLSEWGSLVLTPAAGCEETSTVSKSGRRSE
ncbi:MAG: hydantoinase/oxoprolinase family protein [Thermoleophilia bacterium]|nr:hydantoinase/oxoprolinase family protein [Thermoleophilia bacterium]